MKITCYLYNIGAFVLPKENEEFATKLPLLPVKTTLFRKICSVDKKHGFKTFF